MWRNRRGMLRVGGARSSALSIDIIHIELRGENERYRGAQTVWRTGCGKGRVGGARCSPLSRIPTSGVSASSGNCAVRQARAGLLA